MMVEFSMLPVCMRIWDVKEWLTDPSKKKCYSPYNWLIESNCRCQNIIEALWYDDTFRRVFTEAGISRHDESFSTFREIHRLVFGYAKKLYSGEEMVSHSNRALNVLTACHAKQLALSVGVAVRCKERSSRPRPWPWQI